jgi:hypothetical protein
MKFVTVLILTTALATSLQAETAARRLYNWSAAALVAGNAADVASSFGRQEGNTVLGGGTFGTSQIALKGAIVAGSLIAQHFILKRHPESAKAVAIANFAMGGAFGGLAVRNKITQ